MTAPNVNRSNSAYRLGLGSSLLVVILQCAYLVALACGFSSLEMKGAPIGDPYFTAMEVLILAMMPAVLVMALSIHASCDERRQHFALISVVFAVVVSVITSSVHATVLLLSREPQFAELDHVFSFEWPSVVYVLDILAWDYFFGFFAIFLALSFGRSGTERWVRGLLLLSGALAFAGLIGAAEDDMAIRNVGIIGYSVVFTLAVGLIACLTWRQIQTEDRRDSLV